MLRVRDIMTKEVLWLNQNETLESAYEMMSEFSLRHIPILNDKKQIVGIISEGDLLMASSYRNGRVSLPNIKVKEVMTRDVMSCKPSNMLGNVVATMMACKINCLPVVEDGVLAGILTTTDILDIYCRAEEENGHSFMPFDFVERKRMAAQG